MADLPRAGREYFHWPLTAAPVDLVFEALVGGAWVPTTRTTDTVTLFIEGPDVAPADRDPAAVILTESEQISFRVKDTEIIIRGKGWINLVTS